MRIFDRKTIHDEFDNDNEASQKTSYGNRIESNIRID